MNTLGIRVSPSQITYVIYEKENRKFILKIYKRPKFLTFPEFLKYIRYNFLDILELHKIKYVAIKQIEYTSLNCNHQRIAIEGVIQESLASSNISGYFIENKKSFNVILKDQSERTKESLKNQNVFIELTKEYGDINLKINNEESREATLSAIVAFKRSIINE